MVSAVSLAVGLKPAPQQSPISCATKCLPSRNITVPEEGSHWHWWGSQWFDLLGILNPHELYSVWCNVLQRANEVSRAQQKHNKHNTLHVILVYESLHFVGVGLSCFHCFVLFLRNGTSQRLDLWKELCFNGKTMQNMFLDPCRTSVHMQEYEGW